MHIRYEELIWTRLNDGCRGMPVVRVAGVDPAQNHANAQLIARCNPATMLKVVEALESCRWAKVAGAHPQWCMKYNEEKVKAALRLLSGQ